MEKKIETVYPKQESYAIMYRLQYHISFETDISNRRGILTNLITRYGIFVLEAKNLNESKRHGMFLLLSIKHRIMSLNVQKKASSRKFNLNCFVKD